MASLLVAGTILLHNKIRDKKEARREKKRQAYEDRYNELQREHSQHEEKQVQRRKTGDSQTQQTGSSPFGDLVEEKEAAYHQPGRRGSQASLRSGDSGDGPAKWVDEVSRTRVKA